MEYLKFDLGYLDRGSIVRVTLEGNAANVRLLDRTNLGYYQRGASHRCWGGHYERSPAVLQVPDYGHWYIVVDYGGYAGRGRASVQVLSPQGV
ncbi:DUF1883 domain-containing protein [Mycobacterium sp. 1245111.1]|uniref:DUF1883 domain-containing protein n=1 Tax=Mycobacterium sp. 1245111.1 TaxID=1834073 RepID=UPI000A591374|nr:DUF1883 domain-containing protein [Mycobacterium sp. 1245111.1]